MGEEEGGGANLFDPACQRRRSKEAQGLASKGLSVRDTTLPSCEILLARDGSGASLF